MVSIFKRSIKEKLSRYEEEESYVVAAFSIQDSSLGGVKVIKLTLLNQLCAKTDYDYPMSGQYKLKKFWIPHLKRNQDQMSSLISRVQCLKPTGNTTFQEQ